MRILDADALLKMINSKKGMIGCTGLRNYINFMAKDDKEIVRRKKGEWLEKEIINEDLEWAEGLQSAKCSVCGRYHTTPYLYSFTDYNFCPDCGADMRKEGEENG